MQSTGQLEDLLLNIPLGFENQPAKMFSAPETFPFTLQAVFNVNNYIITSASNPRVTSHFDGLRVQLDLGSDELNNVRHEMVGSLCAGSSDVPFSIIDPNFSAETAQDFHRLTPDFYNKDAHSVLELATTYSDDPISLERAYHKKFLTYDTYCKKSQVKHFFIVIVSPNFVYSNYPFNTESIIELCTRMKLGIAIEAHITESQGTDIFKDKSEQENYRICKATLSSISVSSDNDGDSFYPETQKSVLIDLTKDQTKYAEELIFQCFKETKILEFEPRTRLEKWLKSFDETSREKNNLKRICNFPFRIAHKMNEGHLGKFSRNVDRLKFGAIPHHLEALWSQILLSDISTIEDEDYATALDTALDTSREYEKHTHKLRRTLKISLSLQDQLELAKKGVQAKNLIGKNIADVEIGHRGFHPMADVRDIEELMNSNLLTRRYENWNAEESTLVSLLEQAKSYSSSSKIMDVNSISIFKKFILRSELVAFADLISSIMEEVAISYKHYTNNNKWMFKELRNFDVAMIIHTTGTHVFVSFGYLKETSSNVDTGRLGPETYDAGAYTFSDLCSFNQEDIEHYIKAGPYMAGILAHLMSSFELDITSLTTEQFFSNANNHELWRSMKFLLLLYLNNKLDVESLVTAQRYFFMNILDEFKPDPYNFVGRLPDVLRSRLTSWCVQESIKNMDFYAKNGVNRIVHKKTLGEDVIEYTNLRPIFSKGPCTLERLINSFYYGYVVTKNRDNGVQSNFVIVKKMLKEEYVYRDMRSEGGKILEPLIKPSPHKTDPILLRYFIAVTNKIMSERVGPNHKDITEREILNDMSRTSFSDLATLKASAKQHSDFVLPPNQEEISFRKYMEGLKKIYPKEFESRPKVLVALTNIADTYESGGGNLIHVIQLLPRCLESMEKQGYLTGDMFSKSQHGGPREIAVFDIIARIVQFFMERISYHLCKQFKSEAITHPSQKEKFVKEHYDEAGVTFQEFLTYGKSSDAAKWCQRHHVVRFMMMMTGLTNPLFHNFIYRGLLLWTRKRITLPADLMAMFRNNPLTPSSDQIFIRMRKDFYEGNAPFVAPFSAQVDIKSGMMQGMLHYSSSMYHTLIQEVMKLYEKRLFMKVLQRPMVVTKIQGSDDSGSLNSVALDKDSKMVAKVLHRVMRWKENVAEYLAVYNSKEKTVMAVNSLIEYNSEWFIRRRSIKPTFRWVSAALELNVSENFISRYRIFSNVLTQVLEGGASTLECSIIQLSQAWLHYKMIGLDSHMLFKEVALNYKELPDPSLGFFPLDCDLASGVSGMEYSLYLLAKYSKFGARLIGLESLSEVDNLDFEGKQSNILSKELNRTGVSYLNTKRYKQLMSSIGLGSKEEIISLVEEHPESVFGGSRVWREDRLSIALKMFTPGVRESLSSRSPLIRTIASSAYILNRPCFKMSTSHDRFSLLEIFKKKREAFALDPIDPEEFDKIKSIFPLVEEYERFDAFTKSLESTIILDSANYVKRNKITLEVFSNQLSEEFSLLSLCKRKWFGMNYAVPVGRTLFNTLWNQALVRYTFLRDTYQETKEETKLNVIHLKFFLESIGSKTRHIKLSDTSGKGSTLETVISRIFWPNIKLRSTAIEHITNEFDQLRSNLYATINFFYTENEAAFRCSERIKQSTNLSVPFESLPSKMKSLKIFYDFLTRSVDKEETIERIRQTKRGVLGYFSIRQDYNPRRRERKGRGEWRGLIGPTACLIRMIGDTVTQVIVSSILGIDHLGKMLINLISEMKLKFPQEAVFSSSKMFLGNRGRIYVSHASELAVPVREDKEFKMDILENIVTSSWKIAVTNYNIRLIFQDLNTQSDLTLLSDTFSQKDWSPTLGYPDCPSHILEHFHNSTPVPMNTWSSFCEVLIPAKSDTGRVIVRERMLEHIANQGFAGVYDLRRLSSLFSKFWSGRISDRVKLKESMTRLEDEFDPSSITDLAISRFVEGLMFDVSNVTLKTDAFMEEELDDFNPDLELMGDLQNQRVSDDELKEILDSLMASDCYTYDVADIFDQVTFGMPLTNRWFYEFNSRLAELSPNLDLNELFNGALMGFSGTVGHLMTVIFRRDMEDDFIREDDEDGEESIDYGDLLRGISDRASSHASVKRISDRVNALRTDIMKNDGFSRQILEKKLQWELSRLNAVSLEQVTTPRSLEQIDKTTTLTEIFKYLSFVGIVDDIPEYQEDERFFFEISVKTLLHKLSKEKQGDDEIDLETYSLYIQSIKALTLSSHFFDMISFLFNIRIRIYERLTLICETVPSYESDKEYRTINYRIPEKQIWEGLEIL